jgi:hypothetical protein
MTSAFVTALAAGLCAAAATAEIAWVDGDARADFADGVAP